MKRIKSYKVFESTKSVESICKKYSIKNWTTLFDLHGPILFKDGEWVYYREFLNNFYEEIGVPAPKKLKFNYYKEV